MKMNKKAAHKTCTVSNWSEFQMLTSPSRPIRCNWTPMLIIMGTSTMVRKLLTMYWYPILTYFGLVEELEPVGEEVNMNDVSVKEELSLSRPIISSADARIPENCQIQGMLKKIVHVCLQSFTFQ
ncbi:hypothetical protein QQ045_018893 [Rhodiola kirilowii]